MRILFVDPACPKPYDPTTLATESLGGTEATVVRVAEGLAEKGLSVVVKQHCRKPESMTESRALYAPFGSESKGGEQPTHVVVLRAAGALYQAKKQFPRAKLYLWCHDLFGGEKLHDYFQAIVDNNAVPILVSEWHKTQMYDAMRAVGFKGQVGARRIYNPISDDLIPDTTPVDTNKLVFFSSPHKGLERTLEVFKQFTNFPELVGCRLYVANPGYFPGGNLEGIPNVVNLGSLAHYEAIAQVRSALCVFHLNNVFPETFGLVHAESNAVGTPFLSSRLGATPELADHPAELTDVTDNKAVIERIVQWKMRGRPKVRGHAHFRLKNILRDWLEVFKI